MAGCLRGRSPARPPASLAHSSYTSTPASPAHARTHHHQQRGLLEELDTISSVPYGIFRESYWCKLIVETLHRSSHTNKGNAIIIICEIISEYTHTLHENQETKPSFAILAHWKSQSDFRRLLWTLWNLVIKQTEGTARNTSTVNLLSQSLNCCINLSDLVDFNNRSGLLWIWWHVKYCVWFFNLYFTTSSLRSEATKSIWPVIIVFAHLTFQNQKSPPS